MIKRSRNNTWNSIPSILVSMTLSLILFPGTFVASPDPLDSTGDLCTVNTVFTPTLVTSADYTDEIAFTSSKNGNGAICIANGDDSNTRCLTNGEANDTQSAWSPDGQKIAFVSNRDFLNGSMLTEIYVMNADGTAQQRLTNNNFDDFSPAWSPDGQTILFVSTRDGKFQIYKMNPDGTNQQRVTASKSYDSNPTWSPDGKLIAFSSDRRGNAQIYVMKPDGTDIVQLTEGEEAYYPAWAPDGKFILYSRGTYVDAYAIYIIDVSTKRHWALTERNSEATDPTWSPNGQFIAFTWQEADTILIKQMNPNGMNVHTLIPAPSLDPAWRPHTPRR